MRPIRLAAFALGAALVVGGGLVLGEELPLVEQVDGYPVDFHKGEQASYAVFHKHDAGWHLIVTAAGGRHHFKGRIWIEGEGKFGQVQQWKGDGERRIEEEEGNWFFKRIKRHENDRELSFDIVEERRQEAGIFFKVDGPGYLKWEIGIGGPHDEDPAEIHPRHVKIGRNGVHPPAVPFATRSHPDEMAMVTQVDGYPRDFHKGEDASFAVFHQPENGWHLIVTSAGKRHHFKGHIWIEGEGRFGKIEQWKGEGERRVEEEEGNWFFKRVTRTEGDRELSFDLVEERGKESGLYFKVEGEGMLKWELGIGGPGDHDPIELRADRVRIGHEGRPAPDVPFLTMAHPE
jgi:hypothetical protein